MVVAVSELDGLMPQLLGARETLLAAFEKRLRSTSLRKNRAMMMAIAMKPSRIAYSVVRLAILLLPQLMHRDLHRDDRSQQDVGHFQDPSLRFRDIAFARWLPLCCGRCAKA